MEQVPQKLSCKKKWPFDFKKFWLGDTSPPCGSHKNISGFGGLPSHINLEPASRAGGAHSTKQPERPKVKLTAITDQSIWNKLAKISPLTPGASKEHQDEALYFLFFSELKRSIKITYDLCHPRPRPRKVHVSQPNSIYSNNTEHRKRRKHFLWNFCDIYNLGFLWST